MFHRQNRFDLKVLVLTAVIAACFTGCQQYASYPPVEITANLQRPAAEPVPTIIAQTVRYARDHYGLSPDLPLNLPEGMPAAAYDKVFAHLQGGAPMHTPGEQSLHITAIRTRGQTAQVDLIYPTNNGFHEFVTIDLQRALFEEWHVTTDRRWAMGGVAPPPPNYSPSPEHTTHVDTN